MSISAVILLGLSIQKKPVSEIPSEEQLVQYLKSHWLTPEEYILAKFRDHDLVFLGEAHKVKHDVELVHRLIPLLYQNGVANLGIEFGCYEYQDKVDRLVSAETYDEDLARWLLFKWGPYWPYKEYLDIYRKAWELNKCLPPGAPKFRIVHLDYRARWDLLKEQMSAAERRAVFFRGERDEHMAAVVIKEFVKSKKKALIYAGAIHAATRYSDPIISDQKVVGFEEKRMGQIVFRKIPSRVFNIQLHFPWPADIDMKSFAYPVDGVIDRIMRGFGDKRIGFDVAGTPFGRLRDDDSYFAAGHKNFALGMFCDGYVFQESFSESEGVTVDPLFITKENFQEALDHLPNLKLRKIYKTPYQFLTDMGMKADFKLQYGDLK